jgi:hypothetical protein
MMRPVDADHVASSWQRVRPRLALVIAVAVLVLGGCSSRAAKPGYLSLADLASSNQGRLVNVSLGMTKEQVVAAMGSEKAETNDGVVHNPWTVEGFTDPSGGRHEVLYYVTRPNPPFTPVSKSLTTPIVLTDGKVVGWGEEALERVSK